MPRFEPVDHDPFAAPQWGFMPVDHNPFDDAASAVVQNAKERVAWEDSFAPQNLWFSPSDVAQGVKNALPQAAEFGLSMAPGPGEAMSARDAWDASGRGAEALGKGEWGNAVSEYGNLATALMGAIPGAGVVARGTKRGAAWMDQNLPASVNKLVDAMTPKASQDTLYAIPAWHGSPHDFDQFKLDKIGTGEGAQVYGHGLYFAEKPEVARSYADALGDFSDSVKFKEGFVPTADEQSLLNKLKGHDRQGRRMTLDGLRSELSTAARHADGYGMPEIAAQRRSELKLIDNLEKNVELQPVGKVYRTELDVEPEQLLDWDKPLSEQPEAVRAFAEASDSPVVKAWKKSGTFDRHTGADLYKVLGHRDQGALSRQLREAGVPGIQYADQHSRFGENVGADQTRNYVIFDDSLVKILGKE